MANIKKWFLQPCLLLVFGTAASAATFTVNSTNDTSDTNTADSVCADASGVCTLRAAIEQANQTAGADAINFDGTVFAGAQTIRLNASLPQISNGLTITGTAPALLVVNGAENYRPFNVAPSAAAAITNLSVIDGYAGESSGGCVSNDGNLTLTNVVIRNCLVNSGSGGGVSSTGTLNVSNSSIYDSRANGGNGGGIFNSGTASVTRTSIYGNSVTGSEFSGNGGGVYNTGGTLTLTDSIVRDNQADNDGGGIANVSGTIDVTRTTVGSATAGGSNLAGNSGGGIFNSTGTANLTNSTVTGNQAINFGGGYYGFTDFIAPTTLNTANATIVNNSAFSFNGGGGGIAASGAVGASTVNINNTIVSQNTGTDIFTGAGGATVSSGYNLIGTTSGMAFAPLVGDQTNVTNPQIAALAQNGGLTPTHALLPRSLAIDKGNSAVSGQTTDQREFTRPVDNSGVANATGGDGADIGAFEVQPAAPTAALVTIGGRVLSANGRGVARARVSMTDSNGETRSVITSAFGTYRFRDVAAGETYIFQVHAKRYKFESLLLNINEDGGTLNFTALP